MGQDRRGESELPGMSARDPEWETEVIAQGRMQCFFQLSFGGILYFRVFLYHVHKWSMGPGPCNVHKVHTDVSRAVSCHHLRNRYYYAGGTMRGMAVFQLSASGKLYRI